MVYGTAQRTANFTISRGRGTWKGNEWNRCARNKRDGRNTRALQLCCIRSPHLLFAFRLYSVCLCLFDEIATCFVVHMHLVHCVPSLCTPGQRCCSCRPFSISVNNRRHFASPIPYHLEPRQIVISFPHPTPQTPQTPFPSRQEAHPHQLPHLPSSP